MSEPGRAFFLHLQKTGGTALTLRLRAALGERAVYPTDGLDGRLPDTVITPSCLLERLRARRDEIQVVTGHFPLALVPAAAEALGAELRTFTLLREPVARTLSFLRHQISTGVATTDSLEEIYDDPFRFHGMIRDHMVKMLSLGVDDATSAGMLADVVPTEDDLEVAKRRLEAIDVVGLQEDAERFARDLEATFGWDLGERIVANRTTPTPVEEAFVERIRRDSALDVALYEHAVELVARRRAEAPT